jgi:predicted O-methyltransferase YrrM
VDIEEGEFISKIIKSINPKKTLEIGCAQGISSLFICDALNGAAHHTILDPNQTSEWQCVGIRNLKHAGYSNFDLIEKGSEIGLPELLDKNVKFDLIFIDGWHTFDHTLVDMFYSIKLLNIGGILIVDDVGMRGVRKAVNYFYNFPNINFFGSTGKLKKTRSRMIFDFLKQSLKPFVFLTGNRIASEIFNPDIRHRNTKLEASMVALKKISDEQVPWNWFKEF